MHGDEITHSVTQETWPKNSCSRLLILASFSSDWHTTGIEILKLLSYWSKATQKSVEPSVTVLVSLNVFIMTLRVVVYSDG